MYKLLGGLANYFKYHEVVTDCAIFRMHNTFTCALLMACSLVVTASQYVGNPIQCIVEGLPTHVVNTYCWISSTFTMPDAFQRQIITGFSPSYLGFMLSQSILNSYSSYLAHGVSTCGCKVGSEVAHPGIANDFNDEGAQKYYTYYQWVCFALFFQAVACHVPKVLWDLFENNLMRTLVMGLNIGICHEKEKTKKKEVILEYLMKHVKQHNLYAIRYWTCECICLINVIVQLYLMNRFFDGEFLSYGWKVMNFSEQTQEDRVDPMVYIFPRVTKCIFHKYGASGSIQKHDSLCILPLNIVNEKTYIFIWFWFMILATLLTALVVYRVVIIACPRIRPRILNAKHRAIPIEVCRALCRKVDMGDWWILLMLGTNMDPIIYREVISELAKKIESTSTNH